MACKRARAVASSEMRVRARGAACELGFGALPEAVRYAVRRGAVSGQGEVPPALGHEANEANATAFGEHPEWR